MKIVYKIILPVILIIGLSGFFVGFLSLHFIKNGLYQEEFLRFKDGVLKNRNLLSADYFEDHFSQSSQNKFEEFFNNINAPAIARLVIWNKEQVIVFSDLKSIKGFHSKGHKDVLRALETGESFFELKDVDLNEPVELNIGDFIDVYMPIELNGQIFGVIEAHLVVESLVEPVNSQLNFIIMIMVGGGILIAVSILFILRFFVIKPLKQLEEAFHKMINGNLDYKLFSDSSDEIGKLIRHFNIMRQSLKMSVENLKEERNRSEAIISSMGEGLFVVDKNNKIILLNPAAEKMFGISLKKALGKKTEDIFEAFKGDQKLPLEEQPSAKIIKTGQPIIADLHDNYYFQTALGGRFPVYLAITPLIGSGVIGAVAVFKDINEEKKLDQAKESFISVASHQLRTPLTTIRWFSEMLNSGDAGELNKDQKDFVDQIYKGVLRLTDLVGILLSLARIEGGRVKIEPVLINLVNFSREIIDEVAPLLKEKKITAELIEPNKNIPEISLDQPLLRQVILNLISNSIRYTDKNGKIKIKIELKENYVVYSIEDNGIGVPSSQKDKIFEKFFRAENAIAKEPEGTGLGLNFIKLIVGMWQGKIWFESEEGTGSIFYFSIPLSGMKAKAGEKVLATQI